MKKFFLVALSSILFQAAGASPVAINGAGSTFAEPIYTKWFDFYQKKNAEAQFNYQGIGSGAGIKQLLAGTVDFAGSDDPINAEDAAKASGPVLHIPIAMGAVVVSYSLSIKAPLKLTGEVLAQIFSGKITKWNDAAITSLNKGLALPDKNITVATRSDSSGTTAVFTDYLAKVSPEWTGKNGKSVNWFAGSLGAKGNAGVAGLIKQNEGTIGYVELVYAKNNNLPMALLKNKAGQYVEASVASVSAAAQKVQKEALQKDFKISITNSAEKQAYPISAFTWMLVYEKMPKTKGSTLVQFAEWSQSEEAQKIASENTYASVPKEIRAEVLKRIKAIRLE